MTIIEILHFDNYLDVASTVSDKYEEVTNEDKLNSIDIIAKYEDAKEILRRLIIIGYNIACIDINDVLANNYTDEYVISLYENEVWCEPAKRDGEYVSIEDSDCVYLLDNCNSKIIHKIIDAKEIYEVEIVEDNCDGDCENCECKPSTASTATYKVNGKKVSKSDYEKAIENIEEKYLDSIRDMLLKYCEIQDEMNEWRKSLNW